MFTSYLDTGGSSGEEGLSPLRASPPPRGSDQIQVWFTEWNCIQGALFLGLQEIAFKADTLFVIQLPETHRPAFSDRQKLVEHVTIPKDSIPKRVGHNILITSTIRISHTYCETLLWWIMSMTVDCQLNIRWKKLPKKLPLYVVKVSSVSGKK